MSTSDHIAFHREMADYYQAAGLDRKAEREQRVAAGMEADQAEAERDREAGS